MTFSFGLISSWFSWMDVSLGFDCFQLYCLSGLEEGVVITSRGLLTMTIPVKIE